MLFQAIVATVRENVEAKKMEGRYVYQFCLSGDNGGDFFISIANNKCEVREGLAVTANLTVNVSDANFVSFLDGKLNPTTAVMTGKIKIKGDISLAMKLQSLLGQEMTAEGSAGPRVQKVGAHTYAVTNLYHTGLVEVNAGFVVTPSAVISIDAGMTVSDGAFLWQVSHQLVPDRRKSLLILTHHHSDHTFGMRIFREQGAEVIAHAHVREFLEEDQGRYKAFIIEHYMASQEEGDRILGEVVLSLPDRLIEEDTLLDLDGEEIHLLATPGHVSSELSVYCPGSKVLFAGDTIYEGMPPNTQFAGAAEKAEWVRQLRRLRKLEIKAIVPGHGKVCGKDEIDRNIALIESDK
ncbi:MBL fold metallo-hydrolase [Candidatus Acetothermia bacterium]|jgi:glyoxylase-like metal-dependent hydrolase (beta-lactamase superfamily II)/putative sterol carrier protein|nr:MBL fold metallo-hydrolase [Candidatus Acetothermia bacterium]MCI2427444.1 MBL fold metallo-hydrolase [Candidatus Acetothermia bacterium]MCI2428567.1 MBL fold metallo-hydrolase [Candidatus Acetothermia bacterium]